MKAKIVRFLTDFDIEDGINSKDVLLLVMEVDFQAEIWGGLKLDHGQVIDYLK